MDDRHRYAQLLLLVEQSLADHTVDGDALARRAHLSRFHFDRLVHAALGEPVGGFRRRLLLERAAARLTATRDRVVDIALDAGYDSPDAFTRAFGRAYGCSPRAFRAEQPRERRIAAPSGVHSHPPGGLRLPADTRSSAMDVLIRMYDHHISLTRDLLDRCASLDATALDRTIELSVEGIDRSPTLRSLLDRTVRQLEMWSAAVVGGTVIDNASASIEEMRTRLDRAEPRFRAEIVDPIRDGRADETFVDATCDPPQMFTLGGVLAHVLTFAAVRRTLAVGALESAGVDDLGSGDPMVFVGGSGADASTINRRYA